MNKLPPLQKKKQVFEINFDLNKVRAELCDWLEQIPFPFYSDASNWNDLIKEYRDDDNQKKQTSGIKLRLRLKLYTTKNEYILSIVECLDSDSLDNNIVVVHVNWKHDELNSFEAINHEYQLHFDSLLKAKHTIWAQTFKLKELNDALDQCALAILGNELKGSPPEQNLSHNKLIPNKTQIRLELPEDEAEVKEEDTEE